MTMESWIWWHRFVSGGIGDMTAACFSHPCDLLKVRMQLLGEGEKSKAVSRGGLIRIASSIVNKEGFKGLYRGLSASLLRQSIFSSMRHGLFGIYSHKVRSENTSVKIFGGMTCGAVSALIANPTDVVLIRMQADGHLAKENRRNYKNGFDGILKILREQSPAKLWVGCTPTVVRAMLVTASQCVTYFKVKPILLKNGFKDNTSTHLISALSSALVAVFVTNPVDIVKTRLMTMKQNQEHISSNRKASPVYNGALNCLRESVKSEGISCLFKGLAATTIRLGPHTVVLWLVQEQITNALKNNQH